MSEGKRGKGRPSQDKVMRPYTIDRKMAEFIDTLPAGDRSRFVNRLIAQGVEEEKLSTNGGDGGTFLKPGELGRVLWTQSLSGDLLVRFVQHYGIDVNLNERELRQQVIDKARPIFKKAVEELLHD